METFTVFTELYGVTRLEIICLILISGGVGFLLGYTYPK